MPWRGQPAIGTTSYQWHGFIESIFRRYKVTLGPYSAADLAFRGVAVVAAAVRQPGRAPNSLASSIATASVDMASWARPTRGK